MRYAFVTGLVVLGTSLAGAGPATFQRERSIPATDPAAIVRIAAAEPTAAEDSAPAAIEGKEERSQGKAGPSSPSSPAGGDKAGTEGKGKADKTSTSDKKSDAPATAAKPELPAGTAKVKVSGAMDSVCLILESAATANGLPLEFFARVIWQESRFQPDAVGPVTRNGHRAQGIAQFMPYTAAERGLLDPFDPVAALPKAAEFLRELRAEFGNLGLAAAAYNAGPRRVRDYLAGRGGMPAQTRHYVAVITGRTVDEWVNLRDSGDRDVIARPTSCQQLAALLTKQPSFFVGELERRVAQGKLRPWGVQLSAGFSRSKAIQAYGRIERQYRGILASHDPMIIRTVLRSRGTNGFYQVRVGLDTRVAADRLCATLRSRGAACMVLKNSRGSPSLLSRSTAPKPQGPKEVKEATRTPAARTPAAREPKRTK